MVLAYTFFKPYIFKIRNDFSYIYIYIYIVLVDGASDRSFDIVYFVFFI